MKATLRSYSDAAPQQPFDVLRCPICSHILNPEGPSCDCAYGTLPPTTYVRLFWEEA